MTNRLSLSLVIIVIFQVCYGHETRTDSDPKADVEVSVHGGNSKLELLGDPAEEIFQEPSSAVIVELSVELLKNLSRLWKDRNIDYEMSNILLATFDSRGLRDRILYEDADSFLQALKDLRGSPANSALLPTFHVIDEIFRDDFSGRPIILITGSKPSDEDFSKILSEALARRKCQVSVLWVGRKDPFEYGSLEDLSRTTGGKFSIFPNEDKPTLNFKYTENEQIFGKNKSENPLNRIKFPASENSGTIDDGLSPRFDIERSAGSLFFPVIVDVASGSALEVRPGILSKIPFTVKNNFNSPLRVDFGAKFGNAAQLIDPQWTVLQPMVTKMVNVILKPPPNNFVNASSRLTFSAFFSNRVVSRSAIVSLIPQTVYDTSEPKLYHKYSGDCSDYQQPHTCEKFYWNLEVTAQDEESGLLKIVSEPYGLVFQSDFLAGTKDPVTAHYTSNCCQPRVDVWVEDVKGNYAKKSFDVLNQTLLAGEIAAIVVGVLLLLFIIIAIVLAVTLIRRRNRRNLIIPRSRADTT
ncbi:hypothetical protein RUM44_001082 [Polyplax serrata]|uniref:VWFA domain-containing protein n=1 Tax=Polyplax serrata TaxID=468196 RepID=A0ABR1B6M4_POLSC